MNLCDVCGRDDSEHTKHERYNHSAKGRARYARYLASEAYREYLARTFCERRERQARNHRKRADAAIMERAFRDPGTLRVIFYGEERAKKMIALAFDKGATEHEKAAAIVKLKQRGGNDDRPGTQSDGRAATRGGNRHGAAVGILCSAGC